MKLITEELKKKLPKLYEQENISDPIAYVKYFTVFSNWYWYGLEFDGEDTFFGLVFGVETELGYFSLTELASIKGPLGLSIERDLYFNPTPLSEIKKLHPNR